MILIESKARIGKTETVKAWCKRQQGWRGTFEVPSSNDDRLFFVAIAQAVGVARGTSYNGQQIKLHVEESLRASGLMLVFDEGQFLWPQYLRPQGIPSRIQWIKTAFDAGTPIALVALPKFSEWQELYARRTLWDDDQLERRLNRKALLPEAHSEDDLLKIARARHPEGGETAWKLLAGHAMAAAKKQASAITEALESASGIAQQAGRESVTYKDIYAAMQLASDRWKCSLARRNNPLCPLPAHVQIANFCCRRTTRLADPTTSRSYIAAAEGATNLHPAGAPGYGGRRDNGFDVARN